MEETTNLLEESSILERAKAGDERALRSILESHYSLIYAVAHGILQNRSDAEDTVQEIFIKIHRSLPSFRGASNLSTWIYSIARNEALNALSRRVDREISIDECSDIISEAKDPESSLSEEEIARTLERCMQRLDEDQRVAIDLRYRGEKSYEEIAEIMDIPLGSVKTNIYRGKMQLRRMLSRQAALEFDKRKAKR